MVRWTPSCAWHWALACRRGSRWATTCPAVLVDITPYTFGTSVLGELYGRPYEHQFVPLIRRNSKLPATRTDAFYTVHEQQQAARIKVYQGEDPDALKNVEIGSFLFEGLNQRQGARERGIVFTYHLDLDGLLNIHAVERATGREIKGVIEHVIGRSTEEALVASRRRVAAQWGDEADAGSTAAAQGAQGSGDGAAPQVAEIRETLERAEKALETAPAEDREEMVDLMEDLRDALKEGNEQRAAELGRNLDEILFYVE